MTQLKANKTTSNESPSTTANVVLEAFIPLFFQENTIIIKNNSNISTEYEPNWKPISLISFGFSASIDHPPEFYFS